ncbi:hypothetical protein BDW69DRAFT_178872 [Aspergillus filifer]
MKLAALVAVLSLGFTALAEPLRPAPVAEVPATAPDADLAKRQCTTSSCRCNGIQGQFCGDSSVNPNCLDTHVYECNPSGATCVYGYRNSCAQCGELSC